ncbi:MAG: hypothetical protein MUF36_02055 [Bacteroidales bacterium]|nr:hypothetical protein [Bacteroidales bacterium]
MKRQIILLVIALNFFLPAFSQLLKTGEGVILFHGIIFDAGTESPLPHSQIFINRVFASISDAEGKFAFYVNRHDTVIFRTLGYSPALMLINDTLNGREFLAGIFLHPDTVNIPEVVIVPRIASLKSDLLRPPSEASKEVENARYNLAVSAYQGRVNQGKLGDPSMNYELLRQQQKNDAYSKGQIPPDKIVGLSPLLLIPAAYLLINGLPEKPAAVKPVVTDQETDLIISRYMEVIKKERRTD